MDRSFETEVITRLTKIETKLDDYKQVRDAAAQALQQSCENAQDIKEIRDNNKWLWRTLLITILSFITSVVLTLFGI